MINANVNRTLSILGCGVILAGGMVATAHVLNRFMVKVQKENTISVKGTAEKQITSDLGAFYCRVTINSQDLPSGYRAVNAAGERMREELRKIGFQPAELEDNGLDYTRVNRVVNGKESGEFSHYEFTRSLRVVSGNVQRIAQARSGLNALLAEGFRVWVGNPEYFISDPEQYKLALIADATASAAKRAESIAAQCRGKVGKLITARQGIIQITRPASSETSDYGVYDTGSIDKTIKIVVTLDFEII